MINGIENIQIKIVGHVLIRDPETGEVLLDKKNAVHPENIGLSLANSWGHKSSGPIEYMCFGNGGTVINNLGVISYKTPNTVGLTADLYSLTYQKIVDDQNLSNPNTAENNIVISHINGNLFTDVIVTCTLDFGEPPNQDTFDNAANTSEPYIFDELGLKDYSGRLLTHVVFSPLQKSQNRLMEIIYTLRISIV